MTGSVIFEKPIPARLVIIATKSFWQKNIRQHRSRPPSLPKPPQGRELRRRLASERIGSAILSDLAEPVTGSADQRDIRPSKDARLEAFSRQQYRHKRNTRH